MARDHGLMRGARIGAQGDPHAAVGARFLQQRGTQRVGAGVDELVPLTDSRPAASRMTTSGSAWRLAGGQIAGLRQVDAHAALIRRGSWRA